MWTRNSPKILILIGTIRHESVVPRVLIFSHISERNGAAILGILAKNLRENSVLIHHLVITTYAERLDGAEDIGMFSYEIAFGGHIVIETGRGSDISKRSFPQEMQKHYIQAWKEYQPKSTISIQMTIEGALHLARAADRGAGVHTLITGSLYLVGNALRLLEYAWNDKGSPENEI